MTKKHFIGLADAIRAAKPAHEPGDTGFTYAKGFADGQMAVWRAMRDALADFCVAYSSKFDRARWLAYIDEKCGPNGGKRP